MKPKNEVNPSHAVRPATSPVVASHRPRALGFLFGSAMNETIHPTDLMHALMRLEANRQAADLRASTDRADALNLKIERVFAAPLEGLGRGSFVVQQGVMPERRNGRKEDTDGEFASLGRQRNDLRYLANGNARTAIAPDRDEVEGDEPDNGEIGDRGMDRQWPRSRTEINGNCD